MNPLSEFMSSRPGETIRLKPDWFVLTDGEHALPGRLGGVRPAEPQKVKVFIDHETPCGSEKSADLQRLLIEYAGENGCELFNGYGVSYQLMLDKYVQPGQLVACCGKFGSIFASAGAFAVSLTAEEMKSAVGSGEIEVAVPETFTLKVTGELRGRANGKDAVLVALPMLAGAKGRTLLVDSAAASWSASDKAAFMQLLSECGCLTAVSGTADSADCSLQLGDVVPMAAGPNDFTRAVPAAECSGTAVTNVFIGGCSQGRIEDIRAAASVIRGRRVARSVRAMVAFATTKDYIAAANEGLIARFLDAGVLVMNQGCSACYGRSQGLADGKDVVLSAGSRPCPNCNGEGDVPTYLCSAATAMASAIAGHICPDEA